MSVLLALDYGTEGVRVGATDLDGALLGSASSGYPTTYPHHGWAEQDPRSWWDATCHAVRDVLAMPDVAAAGEVVGVGLATTASTVVVIDEAGEPLRPALLWMDGRAGEESRQTAALRDAHPVLAYSGGSDAVEWLVPKAMWLARHETEVWNRAAHVVECVDYLAWRLTGRWTASQMNAVCKANYDATVGRWPDDLFADLGVAGLRDKLPDTVLPVGSPIGPLTDSAASDLGLSSRPVVAVGGIDAHVSLLACGGDGISVVAGTSTVFITEVDEPVWADTVWGPYPGALTPGRWLVEGGQVSSGSALSWTSQELLSVPREQLGGLVDAASAIAPDAHGLVAIDNLMGNRTPLRDPSLRGAFVGLSLGTTRPEIYRAATEAVAYGTRAVLESFDDLGIGDGRLVVSGGIRLNPLWLKVTLDVVGRPLEVVESDNLTLRACAAFAATAAGVHPDLWAAAAAYRPRTTTLTPDAEVAEAYDEGYRRYRAVNEALTPTFHELATRKGSA